MNKTLERDIENELSKALDEHNKNTNMSTIVAKLEADDLQTQTTQYNSLMDREAQDLISQLRHRAMMLRNRADELDGIADSMTKFYQDLYHKAETFVRTANETRAVLETMSHINPTKVTNGE